MPYRFLKLATVLIAVGFVFSSTASEAQTPGDRKPPSREGQVSPFVSILGEERAWRSYETNAIPLLFNWARFGWRMYLGGPDRRVALIETMTTSQPMAQVVPGPGVEVNPDKTKVVVRLPIYVLNGYAQRAQGIVPGDPPGIYTYQISIDGEPRGELVFCAIEIPEQDSNLDPRSLYCPNKFQAVERMPPAPWPSTL